MISDIKLAFAFHQLSLDVLTCRQKCNSSIARTHPYSTHIHPHSAVGHVIMSITSCLSGTICPLIKPHTMWITVQSPCLAPLHLRSPRVKTPWLKLHWFLFIHLPLFPFFIPIKGKKQFYCLHMCVCVVIGDILFAWLLHIFMPAWIRVPMISSRNPEQL